MSMVSDAIRPPVRMTAETTGSMWTGLWQRLGRTTSSGRLIPAIDGLRSVAILAVIMHHLGGYVAQRTPGLDIRDARQTMAFHLINVGNCGVQLFFIISGFILALPFAEHRLCGGKPVRMTFYFWRRLTRLHPPYLLNLALMTIMLLLVKHEGWSEVGPHLLASSLYLHNLVYHTMSTVNGVAWSLEIEVQFYLLAPFLTLAYCIPQTILRRSMIAVAATAVMLLKWNAGESITYPLSGSVLYYLDYFLCGLLLADWHSMLRNCPPAKRLQGILWDVVGLVSASGCVVAILNAATWYLLPLALLPACAAVLRGPRLNRLLSMPLFVIIGGMCYTTYLYHFSVISLAGRFVAPWTTGFSYPAALAVQSAIIIPMILCLSAILFQLVEKPCMSWGRSMR